MLNQQDLEYSLAKRVPAMARGFTVSTNYGDIYIPAGKLATELQMHMERGLMRELDAKKPGAAA